MSQRGGEVQSHLRIADHDIHSDLIPKGRVDMILAVEPLESLRYVEYLSDHGAIVTSTVPFMNIPTYPAVEEVLANIASHPRHVLVDADRLARAAGSGRAVNTVMLGAASTLLPFDVGELDASIAEMFRPQRRQRGRDQPAGLSIRAQRGGGVHDGAAPWREVRRGAPLGGDALAGGAGRF